MKPFDKPIQVTRPYLPPLLEFTRGLEEIWDNRRLTNRGPILERLERSLAQVFQTNNVSVLANGTLALQVGLQALQLTGEVITTPFTFAATSNAIVQARLTPVFSDIEPEHFTLDPECVEAAITPRTSAILAVHVFGFPCRWTRLAEIAKRHGLALIYDAAHAFGTTIDERSVATLGDLSMFSFHATKLFHTLEGGALTFSRPELKERIDRLCNHGFDAEGDVKNGGTNAKMTEFQALMGTLLLPRLEEVAGYAREIVQTYRSRLSTVPGIVLPSALPRNVRPSDSFMVILVEPDEFGMSRDALQAALARFNVFTRRYFFPLISDMASYRTYRGGDKVVLARKIASQVLILPLFADLPVDDVHRICDLIAGIREGGRRAFPDLPG